MTPRERLAEIVQGMQEDQVGYQDLRGLLERQFEAAVRHDVQALKQVADAIIAKVADLDRNRGTRVEHTAALLGADVRPSMSELLRRLNGPAALQMTGMWSRLEALVRECKALNVRNCRLIMEQEEIMRHVLVKEEGVYAPAV